MRHDHIRHIEMEAEFTRCLLGPRAVASGWSFWPAVAIRVRVTAVFEQTPRPGTGHPLA